ncbi:glycosyltransferase [Plasticicumulans acidivorans]|uniref:Glycosyltransferase involved in cell wall biosynthesis n=1 Tax=Plasticicumulans acidivorans TaxID=886464 RepID=A0A317MX28_9GAMM|nr:glycosyltransferase [Plasticicumulans acidivorans]PWV62520.1 glycosyltransferase involved in cell wall biosynthesis [Plasticicumulans acidivorans]
MKRLAVLISFSGAGGVERMVLNLVAGLAARGIAIDILAIRAASAHLGALPDGVRLLDLKAGSSLLAVPAIARYLQHARPCALLAAKDRAIRAAVLARRLAGVDCRLVGRLGTTLSAALEGRSGFSRWLRVAPMRWFYRHVDHIVAVSQGVLDDTAHLSGMPRARLSVIRNPVITPQLNTQAAEPLDHPWINVPDVPLILGAGRLTEQKDFPTLLRAFARLRARQPARLVILGEGRGRAALSALAAELHVACDVEMPGFTPNPYMWMARAQLFVLSSAWEGSPNVLTEALALGTPSVATDCPSGPREVLAGGRFGRLVAVGDDAALADAMAATLAAPLPAATLRAAVSEYTQEAASAAYLRVLLPVLDA